MTTDPPAQGRGSRAHALRRRAGPESHALAIRVSLRCPDGNVVERVRFCWRVQPSAADVLRAVAAQALAARRRGLRLGVDEAPAELTTLLAAVGFS